MVGSSGAGEEVSSDPAPSALEVLPRAKAEPVTATERRERNSLRPVTCVSCLFESMLPPMIRVNVPSP